VEQEGSEARAGRMAELFGLIQALLVRFAERPDWAKVARSLADGGLRVLLLEVARTARSHRR